MYDRLWGHFHLFLKQTMSTSSSSQAEAARIKEVYRRREIDIAEDRYSLFKE
jgi:hypothetical protein